MRSLSSALITELGLTLTRPGYLIEMGFSTPQYLSTLGDVTWGGHTWTAAHDCRIDGLAREGSLKRQASISLGNLDNAWSAVILGEGVSDTTFKIYAVYAGAPSDAVLDFDGAGNAAEVGDRVTISLVSNATQRAFLPRRRIGAGTGFNTLIPAGSIVSIGGQKYTLERS